MNILQLHNKYFYYGGEDTVVRNEYVLLKKKGHNVSQIFRDNKLEIKNFKDNINVLKNLSYSKSSLEILDKYFLKNKLPDIVHIHNLFPLWTYSVLDYFKKKNIPIVMTIHNYRLVHSKLNFFDKNFYKYGYFKNSKMKTIIISKIFNKNFKLLQSIDKIITFSEFTQQKNLLSGIKKNKFIIKPNFLFEKQKYDFKQKKIQNKNFGIYASRLSYDKGIKTLIQACNGLKAKIKIYGDGPLLNNLKKNFDPKVNYKLYGPRKYKFMQKEIHNSKFLIFPSEWYECMPMVILEAFKAGTLVIASRIGSISNIISHMNNGILFKPGDVNDLKNKINWVLDNPEKCNTIARNAKSDFNNYYTEKNNYKILFNIYKKLIKRK